MSNEISLKVISDKPEPPLRKRDKKVPFIKYFVNLSVLRGWRKRF